MNDFSEIEKTRMRNMVSRNMQYGYSYKAFCARAG